MERNILDSFVTFIMQFTPGESMALGALVGLLPILLVLLRHRVRSEEVMAESASQTLTPSESERLLTCVICKHKVRTSAFAAHVEGHSSEGYVSPPMQQGTHHSQPSRHTPL